MYNVHALYNVHFGRLTNNSYSFPLFVCFLSFPSKMTLLSFYPFHNGFSFFQSFPQWLCFVFFPFRHLSLITNKIFTSETFFSFLFLLLIPSDVPARFSFLFASVRRNAPFLPAPPPLQELRNLPLFLLHHCNCI